MMPVLECFMTNKRPFGLPSAKLIVIAGLAGLIAGAVAVYVRNAGSGNAGPGGEVVATGGACEGTVELARKVDELARGDVAAMAAATSPRILDLSFKGPQGQDLRTADFEIGRASCRERVCQ